MAPDPHRCRRSAALGTFMTAAALLEVDTCAIEGFDPIA
jgi:nitroreductase